MDTADSSTPRVAGRVAGLVNWIALSIIIIALLALARALPLEAMLGAVEVWLEGLGVWAPVVYGAIYALATILFVPGWIMTVAAGVFFGLLVGTITASLGSVLGVAIAFLIARHLARDRVRGTLEGSRTLRALDDAIGEGGWKIVALLRLSPAVPFNLQNYLYGVTQVRLGPCVLASWLAMLPGTFMYVYFGHVAGAIVSDGRRRTPLDWIALGIGLAATIAVTAYVTWLARRKRRQQTGIDDAAESSDHPPKASPSMVRPVITSLIALALAVGAAYAHAHEQRLASALSGLLGPPQVSMREAYEPTPAGPSFDHRRFDAVLRAHVDADGWVDYHALSADPAALDDYIAALGEAPFDDLGRDEKLALLINAYNAFTLRLVLDHWDGGALESIRDIPAAQRWDDERWAVGGHIWSLNQIEHEQIRPKFREPRIHFALVCAAVGCPPLRPEAYDAGRLESQLADQARFVHGHVTWFDHDPAAGAVRLTRLYDWYGSDFEQVAGSVRAYAARYSGTLADALRRGPPPTIHWIRYDWALNSTANRQAR